MSQDFANSNEITNEITNEKKILNDFYNDIYHNLIDLLIDTSVIHHVIGYYKGIGRLRKYINEPELLIIVKNVLIKVAQTLQLIAPNRLRTINCIYWPARFETGHAIQGSTGLGTLASEDYTTKLVKEYKEIFNTYSYTYDPYDQFYGDIYNLFMCW